MTTLHLAVHRTSAVPLHCQIYDGIRQAILDGRLRPDQRVPSTRALAVDLDVSRLPVLSPHTTSFCTRVYLVGRVGSGTFISGDIPDDLLRPHALPAVASRKSARRRAPPRARDEGGRGPFRMSLPALDRFPHETWARLVSRHAHGMAHGHMAYGDPAGLPALRVAIAEHLGSARAVRCEAEQVLIVSGSQAPLRLAAAVLLEPGDRVAMEEPGYPGAREALAAGGAEPVSVPVDDEGMSVEALRRRGGRMRASLCRWMAGNRSTSAIQSRVAHA